MKTNIEVNVCKSPNDPKLSDSGGRARPLHGGGKVAAEAAGVTDRSSSLQRMVRRLVIDRRERLVRVYLHERSTTPIDLFLVGTPRHPAVEIRLPAMSLSRENLAAFMDAITVIGEEADELRHRQLSGQAPESVSTKTETTSEPSNS